MPLIYITGLSGSGKSTISEELKKRGFESHDADSENFNAWYEIKTGKPIKDDKLIETSEEWYKNYQWQTSRAMVEKLAKNAKNKIIFLCGASYNENSCWDLFDKVICLIINESTLRKRILTRTTNTFGKKKHEFDSILEWYKNYPGDYIKMGARIVDANRPLNVVIDEIIKNLN